jgi:hypothetical protein
LKQYIADYEDIINDSNNENATQYFDDLSYILSAIDEIKLIEFESNELFLTSFDLINSAEFVLITSLLADKTFEHRLIAKDEITISEIIFEIVSYIYISIIESRY